MVKLPFEARKGGLGEGGNGFADVRYLRTK
jgi:hypothetical protein